MWGAGGKPGILAMHLKVLQSLQGSITRFPMRLPHISISTHCKEGWQFHRNAACIDCSYCTMQSAFVESTTPELHGSGLAHTSESEAQMCKWCCPLSLLKPLSLLSLSILLNFKI